MKHIQQAIFIGLYLIVLIITGCSSLDRDQRSLFITGRANVCQGRYEKAIPILENYLSQSPHGDRASRARFFLGKAYVGLNRYSMARSEFEAVIRDYPDSLEAHKSQYKLAMLEMWTGNQAAATQRLKKLVNNANCPLLPEASAMLRYWQGDATPSAESNR